MHQFKWDKTEEITSFACYKDDYFPPEFFKINYNEEENEMQWKYNNLYNNTNDLDPYNHYAYDCNFLKEQKHIITFRSGKITNVLYVIMCIMIKN